MAEVKLFGAWPSPFSYRIIWALKLKGIPYEYVAEDLSNKSALLLQYNPVHKKIPVLVDDGKPVCESMIILEYLDEKWPSQYPLLPTDPYERATARFWIKFVEDKGAAQWKVFRATGEELEKTVKDTKEVLKTIEEHAMKSVEKYFGGDKINMVDFAFCVFTVWLESLEEVAGVKILDPHEFPKLHAWTNNFKEAPVIKDNLPDFDKMVAFFKRRRETILASA